MNILFIMYDQLRFDYLSCAGHAHLQTPNFDRVAAMGVRFNRAYVQSPICGASRMSFYTGRYVSSHGAEWNNFPLRVGEITLGDHLRQLGVDTWLLGKTHMKADAKGMARLGLSPDSIIGARQAECGFDVWVRDDGLWAQGPDGFYDSKRSPYNEYLKAQGYDGDNPWADYANAGIDEAGNIASGWFFKNADKPANIREQDSETTWLTSETMRFVDQAQSSWLAHVSYIKPHWPYIVPAPYHDMFGSGDILPARRHQSEREDPHPVYDAFMRSKIGQAFSQERVRKKVIPAYMGLVKQADDQLGRLLNHLEKSGKIKDTMIVLTSDHGDYLGDHWLGEKSFFHEPSVKVPLIIYDPRHQADATRGITCDALVESIDLAATFVETAGGDVPEHILEGRSLLPWLHNNQPKDWRQFVISEYNYSASSACQMLKVSNDDARLFMLYDGRFKLIHAEGKFRPMLFDTANDPDEFYDIGGHAAHRKTIARLYEMLGHWSRRNAQRVTRSDSDIAAMRESSSRQGVLNFLFDSDEVPSVLTEKYRGPVRQRYVNPTPKNLDKPNTEHS